MKEEFGSSDYSNRMQETLKSAEPAEQDYKQLLKEYLSLNDEVRKARDANDDAAYQHAKERCAEFLNTKMGEPWRRYILAVNGYPENASHVYVEGMRVIGWGEHGSFLGGVPQQKEYDARRKVALSEMWFPVDLGAKGRPPRAIDARAQIIRDGKVLPGDYEVVRAWSLTEEETKGLKG
jgi:hypothetical protein